MFIEDYDSSVVHLCTAAAYKFLFVSVPFIHSDRRPQAPFAIHGESKNLSAEVFCKICPSS